MTGCHGPPAVREDDELVQKRSNFQSFQTTGARLPLPADQTGEQSEVPSARIVCVCGSRAVNVAFLHRNMS